MQNPTFRALRPADLGGDQADSVDDRVRRATEARIAEAAQRGPEYIEVRLAELEREWDVDRWLETGAASVSLLGAALGATVNRKWFLLPAAVAGFLLQHTVQGWCPPLPLLRRLGVRTSDEINRERYALKVLRGDFAEVPSTDASHSVDEVIHATRH
ncbi:DUF2892 domain-containing protein [Aquabacterium sp. A7-Y]|uniref:YgaP family membrane protein n=1 Tax=Aquabacterium sp. A7-Y TaxID=1349605 RepID=UPI00223CB54F|nr:DUF2892 domain-containing protein [Aquabacterium sp. A7-Y]MCW7538340.1 DUF2892 domain-containing protein [Aquabacterium sp. A7-Y]